ncbi:secretin N-terminal domain-containing protein [Aeoliella sp. SH292]|uniref:secretin N-terminal domain-containing protein n=1 Tax=Aeoliella sp. SH292 TaxID=3454464 RepID=UPI003F984F81
MSTISTFARVRSWTLPCVATLCLAIASPLLAAEAEFVGLLALATEPSSTATLKLTDDQEQKLLDLLDSREAAALAVAAQVRDLSPEERSEKLRPLRAESQRQMAIILSDAQIDSLNTLAATKPNEFYEPLGEAPAAAPQPTSEAVPTDEQPAAENSATTEASSDGEAIPEGTAEPQMEDSAADETKPDAEAAPAEGSEQAADQESDDDREETEDRGPGSSRERGGFGSRFGGREAGERPSFGGRGERPSFGGPSRRSDDEEDGPSRGSSSRGESSRSEPAPSTADISTFPKADADGKLSFNFRYQPWQDVLDWFAEQSDLSLVLESPPSGTFNYTDSRSYTPAEALDVLNSVLLTKGYTLVRRERMLVLVNLEDGIPPNLVTDIPLDELDKHGEYELVRVLFHVRNMTPEAASEEVSRMVGPQGAVVVLPRAGMLQVTETAGRIRAIRKVIEAIEDPESLKTGDIKPYDLQYASASAVLPVLRQMLNIPIDQFATADGTLRLAVDTSSGSRLLAFGTPEMIRRLEEVLKLVDVPGAGGGPLDQLQLEVYPVSQADPDATLLVLQTLLADEPGTRLTIDPATGNLVALATSRNHNTIRATLGQMQEDARMIEVIPLSSVEPQLALLSINKLFGITTGEGANPRAPIVDADLSSRSLMVRGSKSQIEQIRALLNQMGESGDADYAATDRGNVRLLPLTSSEARSALDQLGQIWPTLRSNPIKMVSPAVAIRSYRPAEQDSPDTAAPEEGLDVEGMFRFGAPEEEEIDQPVPSDRGANTQRRIRATPAVFAGQSEGSVVAVADPAQAAPETDELAAPVTEPAAEAPATDNTPATEETVPTTKAKPGSPILVAPGPSGLLIASDDLEALDAFERLLEASTTATTSGREYAVFYLKHAKAATAAAILGEVFGASGGTGGDSLMGGIADAALGDIGGGLMGDLLGLGGSGAATGFSAAGVDIVTDARLNMLIVYARPDDIDQVFRLLQVIDQRIGPTDIEAGGLPRMIQVNNTSAATVADVVKSLYADRIEGGAGGQPSPEDFMKMLRQGGPGGDNAAAQEPAKMSVTVDTRSNSLVVRAPDELFNQVKALVAQLDTEQLDSAQSTQIVSLKYSNTNAIKEALGNILGEQAVTTTTQQNAGQQQGREGGGDQARQREEMIRRFQEMRQRMEQGGGRGGPGGGGRGGGGDRGGRGGGRGGR